MERPACSWVGRLNIDKMSVLFKASFGFSAIPIKFQQPFCRNGKVSIKSYGNVGGP